MLASAAGRPTSPERITPSVGICARSPLRWARAPITPGFVRLSRWRHGSQSPGRGHSHHDVEGGVVKAEGRAPGKLTRAGITLHAVAGQPTQSDAQTAQRGRGA